MGSLISEEYREQNALLHAEKPGYGAGGAKWAPLVRQLASQTDTVLDYGCGKGELAKALWPRPIHEYDPAIEGKNVAQSCDIVVCTDVLEHIEPESMQAVMEHLVALTKRHFFFSIATCKAKKDLPDGRNAHLSVWPASWWKNYLTKYFNLLAFEEHQYGVTGLGAPIKEVPTINSVSARPEDERIENMRINSKMVDQRLCDNIPPHDRTAILYCSGPSLKATWSLDEDGDRLTVSNAHDFMISKGVYPLAHMDCDPRPHKHEMVTPNGLVQYWLASCCHPQYIEKLNGFDVALWHLHNGPETQDALFNEIEPDGWLLVGGGSIGLRAISLLYSQGYRNFSIHGMDCSYLNGEHHASFHTGKNDSQVIKVRCGERWFEASLSMIDYARQFLDDLRLWEGSTFKMQGDGLLQEMCKHGRTINV